MDLPFRVLYAAYAKGTHHKLALDALRHLQGEDAQAWRRMFLKHTNVYLQGSKAPDDEFKDFKNHVLHVRDDFWGGAPLKARSWYTHLVEALQRRDWPTAAYCAGVLSHYVTDPIQPFHTGQSEAENNIHRAVEWSISKSYEDLRALAERELPPPKAVETSSTPNWLETLVCWAATEANRDYEKLIAHYDIHRGVVDPPSGLDAIARKSVARLLALAAAVHGAVLMRAIREAKVPAPEVSLTLENILATLQVPAKWVTAKLADKEERRVVQQMYDELKATGTVEHTLSEDDRTVRDLHAAEVLAKRAAPDIAAKFPFQATPKVVTTVQRSRRNGTDTAALPVHQEPRKVSAPPVRTLVAAPERAPAPPPQHSTPENAGEAEPSHDEGPKIYLTLEQDVVDAPSIGPKTAERLNAVGIDTVDDLLKAHPIALAARLNDRHIKEETIADWQDQTRLVCTVPGLRGTGAQLLVGAGHRTASAIAAADADKLCADVLAFAATSEGQRLLRSGSPPDLTRIKTWVESAKRTKAA